MSIKSLGNGKWKIIVTKRVSGQSNKKRVVTIYGSKLDAQNKEIEVKNTLDKYVQDLINNKRKSSLKSKKRIHTFGEALDLYEQNGNTWKSGYVNRLREHLQNSILTGNIEEKGIWDDLQAFVYYMQNEATHNNGLPYANSTINHHINIARRAVREAYTYFRVIDGHYLYGFPLLPVDNIHYRTLDNVERNKLFDHLPEYLKPFVYTAMRVPTRISELVNLTVDHINYDKMLFQLQGTETKNKNPRWLPIFPEMEEYIHSIPKKQKYIFVKKPGTPTPLGYYSKKKKKYLFSEYEQWHSALSNAKIEKYNFHKTRQQSAMQMLSDGYNETETMMVGGWNTHKAFQRYVRGTSEGLQEKMGKIVKDDSWKKNLAPNAIQL